MLRYDMRGHGRSDAPPPPYSIAALASDALGLWGALGIDRSHWVGLSLGAMIGVHLAARHPQTVSQFRRRGFPPRRQRGLPGRVRGSHPYHPRAGHGGHGRAHHGALLFSRLRCGQSSGGRTVQPDDPGDLGRTATSAVARHSSGLAEGPNLPKIAVPSLFIGGELDIGGAARPDAGDGGCGARRPLCDDRGRGPHRQHRERLGASSPRSSRSLRRIDGAALACPAAPV